jgi:hypothetical protein
VRKGASSDQGRDVLRAGFSFELDGYVEGFQDGGAVGFELEIQRQLAEHAHGAEAAAVVWGNAETVNGLAVIGRGIARVLFPAVSRVAQG